MKIYVNEKNHLQDFIRLNERWITEYFALEDSDRALAANPAKVIDDGGYVFSLEHDEKVLGVCALFRDGGDRFQLARMAVDPDSQGLGYGRELMGFALKSAQSDGASSIYLLSNTILNAAISLYKRFGFVPVFEGAHPVYKRCNIVMELRFE